MLQVLGKTLYLWSDTYYTEESLCVLCNYLSIEMIKQNLDPFLKIVHLLAAHFCVHSTFILHFWHCMEYEMNIGTSTYSKQDNHLEGDKGMTHMQLSSYGTCHAQRMLSAVNIMRTFLQSAMNKNKMCL